MNTKVSMVLVASASLAGLLGCSTPAAVVPKIADAPPPLMTGYELREGQLVPKREEAPARICRLGTTCLTMDPRPFEPCLLATRHCNDKVLEPLLVGPPEWIAPAPQEVLQVHR